MNKLFFSLILSGLLAFFQWRIIHLNVDAIIDGALLLTLVNPVTLFAPRIFSQVGTKQGFSLIWRGVVSSIPALVFFFTPYLWIFRWLVRLFSKSTEQKNTSKVNLAKFLAEVNGYFLLYLVVFFVVTILAKDVLFELTVTDSQRFVVLALSALPSLFFAMTLYDRLNKHYPAETTEAVFSKAISKKVFSVPTHQNRDAVIYIARGNQSDGPIQLKREIK